MYLSINLFSVFFFFISVYIIEGKLDPEDDILYDTFPKGFMWGVASSAYQVEGGWDEGGKGLSNWDVWTQDPESGHVSDKSNGNVAADTYHKYKEDVNIVADMGLHVFRMSIAWARILPTGIGKVNREVSLFLVTIDQGLVRFTLDLL